MSRWPSQEERLWSQIKEDENGCWIWIGGTRNQYGRASWNGKRSYVHRVIYELFRGEIPTGLELDHLCRVTRCCNPDHLEPVSHFENMIRSPHQLRPGDMCPGGLKELAKTHCPSGHPYDDQNTGRYKNGHRYCRTCNRLRHRKGYRPIAEAATAAVIAALEEEA